MEDGNWAKFDTVFGLSPAVSFVAFKEDLGSTSLDDIIMLSVFLTVLEESTLFL